MLQLKYAVPSNFFKPETRSGYYVGKQMKELWAIEMDLVQEFDRVCSKYGLRWFALGGTLLGAIRHKGFIPWDDDIDLIMPREDYNKLLKIGPEEFCEPYFFQCSLTENKFWRTHVQIRNSQTTGCTLKDAQKRINRGIFIDIFVLDEVPESLKERDLHRKHIRSKKWLRTIERMRVSSKPVCYLGNIIACILGDRSYRLMFNKVNKACSIFQGQGSKKVAHTTLSYAESRVWDRKESEEIIQTDFEYIKINIPTGYKNILAGYFGKNYMEIPQDHPKSTHGALIIDTHTPYTDFFGR